MNGDYHLTVLFEELSIQLLFDIWKEMRKYAKEGDDDALNVARLVDNVITYRSKLEQDWYHDSQLLSGLFH